MDFLTLQHFAGCLNERFSATYSGMDIEFMLIEARPLTQHMPNAVREPFVLYFLNSAAFLFPQQTYQMRHPRLGELGIFVVPVARRQDGFVYEAVFN